MVFKGVFKSSFGRYHHLHTDKKALFLPHGNQQKEMASFVSSAVFNVYFVHHSGATGSFTIVHVVEQGKLPGFALQGYFECGAKL